MRNKGFSLIELIIVVIIILIMIAAVWGVMKQKAGAAEISPMVILLKAHHVPFVWDDDSGRLIILPNEFTKRWPNPSDACPVLKKLDASLTSVTYSNASEINEETTLVWETEGTVTPSGREVATCQ